MAIPEPRRVRRGARDLEAAAGLLAEARFPVIVAGGGVLFSDGQAECVALAELLGAPVVTSYLHNDVFPSRHPLWCGPLGYQGAKAGMKLLSGADVVLALGTRLGPSAPCRSTGWITGPRTPASSRWTPTIACWGWCARCRWASAATPSRRRRRWRPSWPRASWPARPR